MSFISNSVMDLFEDALTASNNEASLVQELGLTPTNVTVNEAEFGWVPNRLHDLFTFRSHLATNPPKTYEATSVVMAVFTMRLDAEGNMLTASPSIKNAHRGLTSKYLPVGDWGERARITPDLFIQADFVVNNDDVLSVPTIYKAPYDGSSTPGTALISLCSANKSTEDYQERHDGAREDFRLLMVNLAEELGVPAGEQFLVCLVGLPAVTKEYPAKDGKPAYWFTGFEGGYLIGGRKIGGSGQLSKNLDVMRVRADMMVGGKSLRDRILSEMTASVHTRTPSTSTRPAPVRSKPTPTTTSATQEVAAPKSTPSTVTTAVSTTSTVQSDVMPSAGILAKLAALDVPEEEDELTLMPMSAVKTQSAQPSVASVASNLQGKSKVRHNPMMAAVEVEETAATVESEASEENHPTDDNDAFTADLGTARSRPNPFA